MAAGMLAAHVPPSAEAIVRSAGVTDVGHQPAHPLAVATMAEYGVDIRDHRSHQMTPADLEDADLVLTMEPWHVREAVVMAPTTYPHTYALKEIIQRASSVGPRDPRDAAAAWTTRLHQGRCARDLLRDEPTSVVEDPTGEPLRVFRVVASEIGSLIEQLSGLVWPRR